jgi:hypothetical protein
MKGLNGHHAGLLRGCVRRRDHHPAAPTIESVNCGTVL